MVIALTWPGKQPNSFHPNYDFIFFLQLNVEKSLCTCEVMHGEVYSHLAGLLFKVEACVWLCDTKTNLHISFLCVEPGVYTETRYVLI